MNEPVNSNLRKLQSIPRVLVISHNPFSDTQNSGKTLTAFFKFWDSDKLAQIYLTKEVPDFSLCKKFFQISDFDIFKRLFNKKIEGREIRYSDLPSLIFEKQGVANNPVLKIMRQNVSPLMRFLRDLMWKTAGYKTKALIKFIDDFDPQLVFMVGSNGVFAFALTRWICYGKNIPLILQPTDDYVTGRFTINPFYWLHLAFLKHNFKWACTYAAKIITIGEKMAREYSTRFGGHYFIAMNTSPPLNLPEYKFENKTIKFVYAGNLGLNRWKILALIAECLVELNQEKGLKGELSVYSLVDPGESVKSALNKLPFSYFKGALNTEELINVKSGADVLVHVEAFDRTNRHITRLSISTKIPEYMASGRCIFAVGPGDVASIEYLLEYKLAVVVTSRYKKDVKQGIESIMVDSTKRIYYANKGVMIVKEQHDAEKVAKSMLQIMTDAIIEKSIRAV